METNQRPTDTAHAGEQFSTRPDGTTQSTFTEGKGPTEFKSPQPGEKIGEKATPGLDARDANLDPNLNRDRNLDPNLRRDINETSARENAGVLNPNGIVTERPDVIRDQKLAAERRDSSLRAIAQDRSRAVSCSASARRRVRARSSASKGWATARSPSSSRRTASATSRFASRVSTSPASASSARKASRTSSRRNVVIVASRRPL